MSDVNENLRDRASRGVVPTDIDIPTPHLPDDLKERYKNDLKERYKDLSLHFGVTPVNDFPDDSLIGRRALVLRAKTSAEINVMGRDLISSLTRGVSEKLVGYIFVLAFQLKRPGAQYTDRLFPIEDELAIAADQAVDTLDDSVIKVLGARTFPVERGSADEIARGYAYLAASMLTMFTKPAENYAKSWMHITEGYRKSYSAPMPVTGVVPLLGVLKQIHFRLSRLDLMKNTLYRFLYNANRDGEISSVQKYLYDTHLSHTGMHIFPIACKICVAMGISSEDLLKVLYKYRFPPQIEGLRAAFKLLLSTGNNYKRMMWKYGRIFDEKVFASLQTKACSKLCFLLACVLQGVSGSSESGIMEIKQFDDVGPELRRKLQDGSKVVISELNKYKDPTSAASSSGFWVKERTRLGSKQVYISNNMW